MCRSFTAGSTFFIPCRASVIKEYGVYWDGINVTLNCKSSVLCFISLLTKAKIAMKSLTKMKLG